MYIIIVGAGEVGTHLAELLSTEQHDVAVIDSMPERVRQISTQLDVLAIEGTGVSTSVLQRAGIEQADLLLAVTNDDEVNIVVSALAKRMGVENTVVRIHNRELREDNREFVLSLSRADQVIDPDTSIADAVVRLLKYRGALNVTELAGGELLLLGAWVTEDSPIKGQTLSELAKARPEQWNHLFVGLTHDGQTSIPRGNASIEVGDQVRVLCTRKAGPEVTRMLGMATHNPKHVLLLGGGDISELVAQRIQYRVRKLFIIERNLERAQYLEENLPAAIVLHGDIADIELLEEADIQRADSVVALTGEDAANITACLYAKQAGAQETIAVVHRLSLLPMMKHAGIDAAISPRTSSADAVLQLVHKGITSISTFLDSEIELVELEVPVDNPMAGQRLMDMHLPKDVLIGAVVIDGKVEIARGITTIPAGGHIIVICPPERIEDIRKAFCEPGT
ncbi:Trk system potassium transporter TrkA [Stomatohabitans albus]|uniref:Trk system potassium transporter TrkA n=1 Tax=Stomatohabitans albus TaxID=3110766 RepID=UPI00300CB13E